MFLFLFLSLSLSVSLSLSLSRFFVSSRDITYVLRHSHLLLGSRASLTCVVLPLWTCQVSAVDPVTTSEKVVAPPVMVAGPAIPHVGEAQIREVLQLALLLHRTVHGHHDHDDSHHHYQLHHRLQNRNNSHHHLLLHRDYHLQHLHHS